MIAAIGGAFVAAIDYRKLELGTNLTEVEAIAEEAIARGRLLGAERDRAAGEARALDARRLALIDAGRAMLETCENVLLAPEELSLDQAIDIVLRAGQRSILGAIDFEQGEYWAVSVFRVVDAELRRVVALRPDPLDEQVDGRTWRRGEGFAGMAWQHESEVIIPTAPSRRSRPPTRCRRTSRRIATRSGTAPSPWFPFRSGRTTLSGARWRYRASGSDASGRCRAMIAARTSKRFN